MISFEQFVMEEGVPVYLQIIRHIKRGIAAGAITDGDEMPSRRMLSALLRVNPNTVQKACRILEEEGLIVSRSGAKSCIRADDDKVKAVRSELLNQDVGNIVAAMKQMGLSKEKALQLIEQLWEGV